MWTKENGARRLLYGVPLDQRTPDQQVPLNDITSAHFIRGDQGLLILTALFDDARGLAYLDFSDPENIQPVPVAGKLHSGEESWFTCSTLRISATCWNTISMAAHGFTKAAWIRESLNSPSPATCAAWARSRMGCVKRSPMTRKLTALLSPSPPPHHRPRFTQSRARNETGSCQHTRERILGIHQETLSTGEDASFTSFDGRRISARLYMPAAHLGFSGPRPVVFYVHGGPQGQERPDFAWFSMPLIQMLALNGFAVFVPNVRGSTGYGLSFTKQVDRDWGGHGSPGSHPRPHGGPAAR